jgi:hypothetical protein
MKKITSIALVLVLALLLPCFVACDGADASTTPTESTVTTPGTDPAPNAETTAAPDAQVTTPDGTCRHAKMGDWVSTGEYTCTGLAISTRACKHCDFVQYDYIEDFSGTVGNHVLGEEVLASYPGASNLPGFELRTCSFCQENVRVETAATNTRKNLLVVTPAMIEAAGLGTVNDYLKSEHGTHIHKNKGGSDWGHIGYTGAHGTGTIYDSFREAEITTNNSVMYWNLKDIDNRYTPNGVLVADGSDETAKYCALIGIDFYSKTTVSGFGVFVENQNEFAFDVLGGTKNADGTTSWKVLGSSSGTYNPYNDTTSFTLGDFEAAEVDCIQIGITTSLAQVVVISEIEIYG